MAKNINLIIFQADRQEWDGSPTTLKVTDFQQKQFTVIKEVALPQGTRTARIEMDVPFDAAQLYALTLEATNHRPTYQFINRQSFVGHDGTEGDAIVRMMLVPADSPSSSDIDDGYAKMQGDNSPMVTTGFAQGTFTGLDIRAKMALLNLEAKMRDTMVNGASLLSFVAGVRFVAVDRLFLFVRSELKQLIDDSGDFSHAEGHGAPEPGDAPPELNLPPHRNSWKGQHFDAGNIQLSFSAAPETLPGSAGQQVFSMDVDIDLERGLPHMIEFLENKIHRGKRTDQTLVYSLLFQQQVTPHYTLKPFAA